MLRGLAVATALMAASWAGPALAGDTAATTPAAPPGSVEKAAPADGGHCLDADGNGICDWYEARGGAPGWFVDADGDGVCDRWQAGGRGVGPAWGRGRGGRRGWSRGIGRGRGAGWGGAGAGQGRGLGYGRGWGLGPHDGRGRGPYFIDANGNGICDRFEAPPQAETPPQK